MRLAGIRQQIDVAISAAEREIAAERAKVLGSLAKERLEHGIVMFD